MSRMNDYDAREQIAKYKKMIQYEQLTDKIVFNARQFVNVAVDKQLPKKLDYTERYVVKCPRCGTAIEIGKPKYCEECGQKFDWSK